MKQKWPTIAAAILLIVSCPILLVVGLILFQKPFMPLIVNGKVIAVVRQPFLRPIWNDGSADVYVGGNKIFSLPENFLDGSPVFIYPFADGRRFLCDYNDDTSLLDFVRCGFQRVRHKHINFIQMASGWLYQNIHGFKGDKRCIWYERHRPFTELCGVARGIQLSDQHNANVNKGWLLWIV